LFLVDLALVPKILFLEDVGELGEGGLWEGHSCIAIEFNHYLFIWLFDVVFYFLVCNWCVEIHLFVAEWDYAALVKLYWLFTDIELLLENGLIHYFHHVFGDYDLVCQF
jgi:hypothetical protein